MLLRAARRPSLAARLWLGAVLLAVLALLGAWLAASGAARMQAYASEALAARTRIEAYSAFQARESEWLMGWLSGALVPGSAGERVAQRITPDPAPVLAALGQLDRLLAEAPALDPGAGAGRGRGAAHLAPAQLRALFLALGNTLSHSPPDSPTGQMALSYHAARAQPLLRLALDHETRRHDEALARMEGLRGPLMAAAAAIAIAAPLVLAGLYLAVLRPLFRRLREAVRAAPALATGRLPAGEGGHDELGLMFARQRQMAARLGRRQARLEGEISARTRDLAAANARLAAIDSNRRRFFADVGHELRTPLTVILGEAELGMSHPEEAVRRSFATVAARAGRLFRRVEDMLRIARSESGQLELQPGPVDLRACIEAALSDLQPVLRRAGITTVLDLPGETLRADGEWLRQVFAGFFENAAKYAGSGASLRIFALPDPEPGTLALRIEDNGPGAGPGAEALFARFARHSGAGPGSPAGPSGARGFGLGLALAHWVVEASGGRLSPARPVSGEGFALDLVLPLWEEG